MDDDTDATPISAPPPKQTPRPAAAAQTQVLLVSHAAGLIDALPDAHRIPLERHPDGTLVSGQGRLEGPPWNWGTR